VVDDAPVLVERRAALAIVTLNRPERLNALSHDLMARLNEAFEEFREDASVRAVVLTGVGRAFSAGADLRSGPSDAEDTLRRYYHPLLRTIDDLAAPVVAAINGPTVGAAVGLVAACDLRVAAAEATFLLPFTRIGLVPDAGATWLLPRIVGAGRAAEMALTGQAVTATQAHTWGLVNEVISGADLLPRAIDVANQLAGLSGTVATTRRLLRDSWTRSYGDQLDAEATAQGWAQHQPDYVQARRELAARVNGR
jgi:2-(1,2-epoxy-1,2-dihydrophenyl)acetyl-CoA isomerase